MKKLILKERFYYHLEYTISMEFINYHWNEQEKSILQATTPQQLLIFHPKHPRFIFPPFLQSLIFHVTVYKNEI